MNEHPEAGHGFLDDHAWPEQGLWPVVSLALCFVPNVGLNEAAGHAAGQRIVTLLHAHLDGAA